ncbi:GDP-mannose 6-dehydrogenase [Pseudonocardia hierapolitana]|uniref:UDP-glucose 6-dehydrogenase n=1 Tax=Pseudonocardia hierapolitana TaxID=1128676 RepID=A0A561SVT6_9PSEU|nr:nucleotide sugar dehydrogenase [Pseudonocardia hierapolitana]TWF78973.1 GDP-mannose 6-dehydrogenase [Pseudonocardia hierapolitana]
MTRSQHAAPLPALSVVGLGYVGCVSAACFAARGHDVVGVDVDEHKAELLRSGRSPIVEERINEIVADGVRSGRLRIVADTQAAVSATDVTLVCVGTPSAPNGSLSTVFLERACADIGAALAAKRSWHVVVFRSTMTPGTCEGLLVPALERASGKRAGVDFGVCINPEYLREGTSVRDFESPPKTVVGESDPRSGDVVMGLYEGMPGPRFRVSIAVAEMSKYVDNSFHALKVAFGNEIGAVCRAAGLDSHQVMDVFLADTKLNISPAYLRPGFAFGGSCLPKDLRALVHTARRHDVDVPLLANVIPANDAHLRRAVDLVVACGRRRVALMGLSFKPGTDDLRESPLVELAERLIGKGYDLRIYDANVSVSRLVGANREHIAEHLPHIGQLLTDDLDEVLAHAEVFIVGSAAPEIAVAMTGIDDRAVVDLVRMADADTRRGSANYVGIGW